MKKAIGVLVTGALLTISASTARADDFVHAEDTAHPEEFTPGFAASRAGALVSLWPAKDNFAMVFGGEMQIRLAPQAFLDMSYVGSFASIHDSIAGIGNGDNLGFGNPTIGAHFAGAAMPNLHFFLGGAVTAPALQDPGDQVSNAAFYGTRIDGYYNLDRFARGYMAVRASGGLEWRLAGPLVMRGELRPVVLIPTSDKFPVISSTRGIPSLAGRGATSFMLEHAVELEVRSDMGLGIGARLQGVTMPMQEDLEQETAEPFVAFSPRR